MRLENLIRPIEQMTDEELMERLREIRHNRDTLRAGAKARDKKAQKKGGQTRIGKLEKMLKGMSADEIIKLLGG